MENDVSMFVLCFLGLMLSSPIFGFTINRFLYKEKSILAAKLSANFIGLGFLLSAASLAIVALTQLDLAFFSKNINTLNLLLSSLVLFVSFVVHKFSLRYMDGDRLYQRFFSLLSLLTFSVMIMVFADNMFLFWFAWSVSNTLLVALMVHKKEWKAARNAGRLVFITLGTGSICLLIALVILAINLQTMSIDTVITQDALLDYPFMSVAAVLIIIGALTQSAVWPFHRWLLSSLNSPTPVSAFMHAGLVNGGGILIVKFSPLIVVHPGGLSILFFFGALSAILGTLWKLMQNDMKRMLACSTLAQMGFMMVQCGLGLFAAAIAHLCWHGLFKAYLFLSSGSALSQGKTYHETNTKSISSLVKALFGGISTVFCFAYMSNKDIFTLQATTFILFFAFIAGTQLTYSLLQRDTSIKQLSVGIFLSAIVGLVYGSSVHFVEKLLPHVMLENLPSLTLMHWLTIGVLGGLWVIFNLNWHQKFSQSKLGCWFYMHMFNASQPLANTITALRKDYNY